MNPSNPAQPPTVNNAINAEANVLAGDDFTQLPLNAEGSEPASNDPAQPPALPPFAVPALPPSAEHAVDAEVNAIASNEDIVIGDYHTCHRILRSNYPINRKNLAVKSADD